MKLVPQIWQPRLMGEAGAGQGHYADELPGWGVVANQIQSPGVANLWLSEAACRGVGRRGGRKVLGGGAGLGRGVESAGEEEPVAARRMDAGGRRCGVEVGRRGW